MTYKIRRADIFYDHWFGEFCSCVVYDGSVMLDYNDKLLFADDHPKKEEVIVNPLSSSPVSLDLCEYSEDILNLINKNEL